MSLYRYPGHCIHCLCLSTFEVFEKKLFIHIPIVEQCPVEFWQLWCVIHIKNENDNPMAYMYIYTICIKSNQVSEKFIFSFSHIKIISCGIGHLGFLDAQKMKFCKGPSNDYFCTFKVQSNLQFLWKILC
jgi:hypothetical protein